MGLEEAPVDLRHDERDFRIHPEGGGVVDEDLPLAEEIPEGAGRFARRGVDEELAFAELGDGAREGEDPLVRPRLGSEKTDVALGGVARCREDLPDFLPDEARRADDADHGAAFRAWGWAWPRFTRRRTQRTSSKIGPVTT